MKKQKSPKLMSSNSRNSIIMVQCLQIDTAVRETGFRGWVSINFPTLPTSPFSENTDHLLPICWRALLSVFQQRRQKFLFHSHLFCSYKSHLMPEPTCLANWQVSSSVILKELFTLGLLASVLPAIVLWLNFLILSFTCYHSKLLITPSETGSASVWHFLHTDSLKILLMSLITAIIILPHLSLTSQQRSTHTHLFFLHT